MSIVRPYGDTTGDGMVQLSFTLPVPHDKRAEGAALQLAAKMGMDPAMLVHAKQMGDGFTFFVVYGRVHHLVDLAKVNVIERDFPLLSAKEVNAVVKRRLRRKLSVVGACIGTDAHTVGIDAILNVKGIAGDKGLEYYRELKVTNLGAQVTVPELVEAARAEKADAVLVSQVVTQRDAHLHNTREMSAAFREALPAGFELQLDEGGGAIRLAHPVMCHGAKSLRLLPGDAPAATDVLVRDRRVDGPFARRGDAMNEREIPTVKIVGREQLPPQPMGVSGERDRQRAGRVAIEAMEHAGVATAAMQSTRIRLGSAQHRVLRGLGLGMGRYRQEARRLVHHENVVHLVEAGQVKARAG
jgi:beta-lysine 5,6-aminomutase beta subunit